jgi:hypothetical protein
LKFVADNQAAIGLANQTGFVKIEAMTNDPHRPHAHDPNPEPPSAESTIILTLPDGRSQAVTTPYLQSLPSLTLRDCYIVSTGHGTSGPFTFGGTSLQTFIAAITAGQPDYHEVEIISGDGFGTRVSRSELLTQRDSPRPILLAWEIDGRLMSRQEGAVRLIVPSETDDALRQVKWVGRINVIRNA